MRFSPRVAAARRLLKIKMIRAAVIEPADLSALRMRPDTRITAGICAIVLSYLIGWPAAVVLSALAVYWDLPWMGYIAAPAVYILSHMVLLIGILLAGETYSRILFRWLTFKIMERLAGPALPLLVLESGACPFIDAS